MCVVRRVVLTVFGVWLGCVLAGCGSSGSNTKATTTTTESPETQQWIAAAREGLLSDSEKPPNMTPVDATCLARALVGTITVAKLEAAGITLAELRDSNSDLGASLSSLPAATKLAVGDALQGCGVGRLIGPLFAKSIAGELRQGKGYTLSPSSNDCVSHEFDNRSNRSLIAEMFLSSNDSDISANGSTALAKILSKCLDWAAIFDSGIQGSFSHAESSCIDRVVPNDPAFTAALASEIKGKKDPNSDRLFGAPLLACLSPAHLEQIGRSAG
jgi:hypothetical protein